MVQKYNKDIIFNIETVVQFESVKPLLMFLHNKTEITFDIIVPREPPDAKLSNKRVYESTAELVVNSGLSVNRYIYDSFLPENIANTGYKILLSAYINYWQYKKISAKYHIMYPYASYYFNKPNWTIDRFIKEDYLADALLSHAVGTKDITDIFTKTYLVPSLKLMDFKKSHMKKEKPILFLATTYNEIDFSTNFLQSIDSIKKEYTVIMRRHHRVYFVKDIKDITEELYNKADKVYDPDEYPITKPLEEADVVISDNSAVIFDAIYCGIPVALFCDNLNTFRYREVGTTQSELVKNGNIKWTNDPKKILHIANETLTAESIDKQNIMRSALFPTTINKNPIEQWMKVLNIYLKELVPVDYVKVKQYWVENIYNLRLDNNKMHVLTDSLNERLVESEANIYKEQNPGIIMSTRRLVKAIIRKAGFLKRGK